MTAQASTSTGVGGGAYPTPAPSASLLLSFRPAGRKVIITGSRRLAATRIFSVLEADAIPVLVGTDCERLEDANEEVQWRIKQGQCEYMAAPSSDSAEAWQALIECVDGTANELFAVCVTDTLHTGDSSEREGERASLSPLARARLLAGICQAKRVPINVADQPLLCDYSFPATHRFSSSPSHAASGSLSPSSLQVAVTTNGKGCRLAGRIRREIVSKLPKNVGDAVERVGEMREMAKRKDGPAPPSGSQGSSVGAVARSTSLRRSTIKRTTEAPVDIEEEDLAFDSTPLNSPVPQLSSPKTDGFFDQVSQRLHSEQEAAEERRRRMRWVAQMSEYWPIEYLGSLSAADMAKALNTYEEKRASAAGDETPRGRMQSREADVTLDGPLPGRLSRRGSSQHSLALLPPNRPSDTPGHIFLVGSGTGHPGLLTTFAHNLLTSADTDLILSDKLVPSSILSLVPKGTPLQIARKFPGNAEGAQSELIALALQGAKEGKRVIRLKQGDPFVYGRGGEEVLAFKRAGVHVTVVPGISSALAAPLMLGIPVTQRGAADSLTLCTGVGRGGKSVKLPGYERSRSLVVLMGVARLSDVIRTLCHGWQSSSSASTPNGEAPSGHRVGDAFPPYTPIAIIERASSSDQRLVASTLDGIEAALARSGEQRPPGMMLIGWATLSLAGLDGNVDVLQDEEECGADVEELERRDRRRVDAWLGPSGFLVREGLDDFYAGYLGLWDHSAPVQRTHVDGKGQSGWAPPRYGNEGPWGGWGSGEPAAAPACPS